MEKIIVLDGKDLKGDYRIGAKKPVDHIEFKHGIASQDTRVTVVRGDPLNDAETWVIRCYEHPTSTSIRRLQQHTKNLPPRVTISQIVLSVNYHLNK